MISYLVGEKIENCKEKFTSFDCKGTKLTVISDPISNWIVYYLA